MGCLHLGAQGTDIDTKKLPNTVEVGEVKLMVAERKLGDVPNSDLQMLIRGSSRVPADWPDGNSERYERVLERSRKGRMCRRY